MLIGASLASFKELTFPQAIELYLPLSREFNLEAVEIWFEKKEGRPSLWAEDIHEEEKNQIIDFVRQFKLAGAHLPFTGLNLIASNPRLKQESINQLKTGIKLASQLGMNYVVMHATGDNPNLDFEQKMLRLTEEIAELARYAHRHSIMLATENVGSLFNLKCLATIVRDINSTNLRITLDVGDAHMRTVHPLLTYPVKEVALKGLDLLPIPFLFKKSMPYEEYGSVENFLELEHDLIFSLHLHDNNGKADHVRLGDGKIDFSFLSRLNERELPGPLILETVFADHHGDFKINYEHLQKFMNRS